MYKWYRIHDRGLIESGRLPCRDTRSNAQLLWKSGDQYQWLFRVNAASITPLGNGTPERTGRGQLTAEQNYHYYICWEPPYGGIQSVLRNIAVAPQPSAHGRGTGNCKNDSCYEDEPNEETSVQKKTRYEDDAFAYHACKDTGGGTQVSPTSGWANLIWLTGKWCHVIYESETGSYGNVGVVGISGLLWPLAGLYIVSVSYTHLTLPTICSV